MHSRLVIHLFVGGFSGRLSFREYFAGMSALGVINVLVVVLAVWIQTLGGMNAAMLVLAVGFVGTMLLGLSMKARRLHDVGKSARRALSCYAMPLAAVFAMPVVLLSCKESGQPFMEGSGFVCLVVLAACGIAALLGWFVCDLWLAAHLNAPGEPFANAYGNPPPASLR